MNRNAARLVNPLSAILEAWVMLGLGAAVSGAIMLAYPDDVGAKVVAMMVFWVAAVASVRMDLAHPYVWLGGTLLLYTTSGPLLFDLGVHPNPVWSNMLIEELDFSFAMDLQYMAFVAVCLVIGPGRVSFERALGDDRIGEIFGGCVPILCIALILPAIAVAEVLTQGFTQKVDIILYGSWAARLTFGLHITATCVAVYLVKLFMEGRPRTAYTVTVGFVAIGVIIVMTMGERNFLFRFLSVAFFVIHIAHRRFSFGSFLLLGFLGGVLITVMGGLKMAAVPNQLLGHIALSFDELIDLSGFRENPAVIDDPVPLVYAKLMLVMAVGNEFMTAGNNLAMLVTRVPYEFPFQNGWTLINDIARALQIGFVVGSETNNTTFLYNWLIFPENMERGGGQGFSLIGTGYFNFGAAGAVMIMVVFGAVVRVVYRWASTSAFGLFFFLGFLPVAISAARNDLSAPLSQGLKHVLLPLVLMMLVSYLSGRNGLAGRAGTLRPSVGAGSR